ncbi:MAG: hypothetical protein EXS25_02660 [Pedosphaera sp.]|nr:hypothetical protein [Pedosphaera sp.]
MTKRVLTLCAAILAGWLAGCGKSEPRLDAQWRFSGADGLRSQKAAPALQRIMSDPNVTELASRLSTNVAKFALEWVEGAKTINDPTKSTEALIRPLVSDLLAHESAGEIWRHTDGTPEILLAVRISTERASVWSDAFPKWVKPYYSGPVGATVSAEKGWLFASSRSGSEKSLTFRNRILGSSALPQRLLEFKSTPGAWLGLDLTATASNGAVRWSGTLSHPKAVGLVLKDWNYPTHLIREPLVAFTAARGVTPFILEAIGTGAFTRGEELGQMYLWSQGDNPFSTYGVVHADKPAHLIAKAHSVIEPRYSTNTLDGRLTGLVIYDQSKQILALSSAPIATPTLSGPTNREPGFVGLSLVSLRRSTNLPPDELFAQMKKPDVVYYDWEITSENIPHWSAGLQVKDISTGLRPSMTEGPGQRLLRKITDTDNTVTLLRQTVPGVLEFQRKAPTGLTAFEWVVLTRWIDPPIAPERKPKSAVGLPNLKP